MPWYFKIFLERCLNPECTNTRISCYLIHVLFYLHLQFNYMEPQVTCLNLMLCLSGKRHHRPLPQNTSCIDYTKNGKSYHLYFSSYPGIIIRVCCPARDSVRLHWTTVVLWANFNMLKCSQWQCEHADVELRLMGVLSALQGFSQSNGKVIFLLDHGPSWKVGIIKVIIVHPQGNANVCIKCHGNSCRDIWLKTRKFNIKGCP